MSKKLPFPEHVYLEEARNVARNAPVFPGDTLSHATASECERRGWIRRDHNGYWVPTETCPWRVIDALENTNGQ